MYFNQDPSNVIANGGSGPERSKWFDSGYDADDLMKPVHVAFKQARERERQLAASHRPLSAEVAMQAGSTALQVSVETGNVI